MTYFRVLPQRTRPPAQPVDKAYLIEDDWDDWFKFSTLYSLVVFDEDGERHALGGVKIGQFGMDDGQRRAAVPDRFDRLDDRFFSLGQDDSYYDDLNHLGAAIRDRVLEGLRDVARDPPLFERALTEKVTGTSLLRSVDNPRSRASSTASLWEASASPTTSSATRPGGGRGASTR